MDLEFYKKFIFRIASEYKFYKINKDTLSKKVKETKDKICFMRHDIDYSPENALKIAQLEYQSGISSTFTILLSGQYYNPFEKETRKKLKKIKNYGHDLGLHFDPTVHEIKFESELQNFIAKETQALEDLLECKIEMFSFHNTTDFIMSCRSDTYAGLINVYSNFFHQEVEYLSDSNGYWRFIAWDEFLAKNYKIIQILTHPIWWKENNNLPPFETIILNSLERFKNEILDYTLLFDGRTDKQNKSALSELMSDVLKQNDSSTMISYAQFSPLIDALLSKKERLNKDDLSSITKLFLKK